MKRFVNLLAFFVISLVSCALPFDMEVDGICYTIVNYQTREVEVTSDFVKYSGSIVIPENITYKHLKYKVTSIGHEAFRDCSNLTSIVIPNSVTKIDKFAFEDCESLTSINIPNSVISIGYGAFWGCGSITAVDIPNSVTDIDNYAFYNCWGIKSLTIGNSVTNIGESAFAGCGNLTSIGIPSSVMSIGEGAFYRCRSLTSFTVDEGNNYYILEDNVLFNKAKTTLLLCLPTKQGAYIIPNSVMSIGFAAFECCTGLTSLYIPDSVTRIGDFGFNGCSGLTSINIPNSVQKIESCAFSGCSALTSMVIPNSVTSIGEYAFSECTNLNSIIIPQSVSNIDCWAFYGCSNLEKFYCYAEEAPSTEADVFENSSVNFATLYVPDNSIQAYRTAAPWSEFGNILPLSMMPVSIGNYNIRAEDQQYYDFSGRKLNNVYCNPIIVTTQKGSRKQIAK